MKLKVLVGSVVAIAALNKAIGLAEAAVARLMMLLWHIDQAQAAARAPLALWALICLLIGLTGSVLLMLDEGKQYEQSAQKSLDLTVVQSSDQQSRRKGA